MGESTRKTELCQTTFPQRGPHAPVWVDGTGAEATVAENERES